MPPKGKGRNAAAAKNPDGPRVQLRRSQRRKKKASTPIENEIQDGPERFAPWYPLLQRVRRDNLNQQDNPPNHNDHLQQGGQAQGEELPGVLKKIQRSLSVAPNIFDNQLVPSDEYPAVQLRNGVLTPEMSRPPRNLAWLQTRLNSARHVSDWPTSKWQSYTWHSYLSTTKEAIMFEMMPLFQEFPSQSEYIRTFYQSFDDFPEYAPFARGIEKPCPGFAQGFRFEAYPCIDIEYLCAAVCFARDQASLIHPHIAGEFTYGDLKALEATSARHGAALVYMRNTALAHIRAQVLEDTAEIVTFTTNGTYIHFFAHYAASSAEGKVEYHQYPILSANLVGSYTEFIQGVTMLRNCQDHALSMATRLRDTLEEYHTKNGINVWTYHLAEGEHILSECEDDEIEDGGGSDDKTEYENEDTASRSHPKSTDDSGKYLVTDGEISSDEDGDSMDDTDSTDYEDDSPPPSPRQAQLRPKRRAAQTEEQTGSSPQKRQAGKSPYESPRKRRR